MLKSIIFLGLSAAATTLAYDLSPVEVSPLEFTPHVKRQFTRVPCSEIGRKDCGDGCIPLLSTCCPDGSGGCPVTSVCQLGNNGKYGCCPIGRVCTGAGGASTNSITLTRTVTDESTVELPPTPVPTTTETPDVPTETPTLTPEETSTQTPEEPSATTSTSLVVPDKTTTTTTTTRAPVPTSTPSPTTSRPPVVTANGALTYGASFVQAVGAAALALFAL
ncbi:GPI anchored serine-threonine rich protein [Colletotrichum truncatum]|uniref:GPI anchored serine-threonine rich protein n=1 Tax=Colletotrichum truncatum TaxID=5467 RepID=A0ACC3ZLG6_COLTU|nr:GPI anchored serine-threonine rich protein [Colletotrichum truncatum]KAF6783937.1 GPI anchored serine-threonine rich protein [Colletotrichum truncatum]